jgi:hypothetical protein
MSDFISVSRIVLEDSPADLVGRLLFGGSLESEDDYGRNTEEILVDGYFWNRKFNLARTFLFVGCFPLSELGFVGFTD